MGEAPLTILVRLAEVAELSDHSLADDVRGWGGREPEDPLDAFAAVMRDKGFLISERVGRLDRYQPAVSRDHMARRSLRETLDAFFAGSSSALVSNLLASEEVTAEELARIIQLVDERLTAGRGEDS